MPESESPPRSLPAALEDALSRAVGTSIHTLGHLRESVIDYSRRQAAHRVPLNDVIVAVGRLLMTAEDNVTARENGEVMRDPELARQIRAWCSQGYGMPS